jgi:nucleoside-diphosphate-sugar epimerase
MTTKLVFGCGYLGRRVAQRWRDAGHHVVVVTRSQTRFDDFIHQGFEALTADVTKPESLSSLPHADTILFAVGHDRNSTPSIFDVYVGGVQNVLAALPTEASRFIYISTTGVYGNADGGWVDEQTPPDPQRDGGRASLAAEQILAAHPVGARSIILRLAGIYGPGRVPFIDDLRDGRPLPSPSEGYLNLIHTDDAAAVVVAAADFEISELGTPNRKPQVYCVSDGHPVQRGEFYREIARQIGAQSPEFVEPDPAAARTARAGANRRVRNARMLTDLRIKLEYPDYRAGLAALLETQNQ